MNEPALQLATLTDDQLQVKYSTSLEHFLDVVTDKPDNWLDEARNIDGLIKLIKAELNNRQINSSLDH